MERYLRDLNPLQLQAAMHTDGPLLIIAGAGSGKTKTIAARMARMVDRSKLPASAILGLSFTNKAALELRERVRRYLPAGTEAPWVGTFHSTCVRILRLHAKELGYSPHFSIVSESDKEDLIRDLLRLIKVDERKFKPATIGFYISRIKNQGASTDRALEDLLASDGKGIPRDYGIITADLYPKYQERLRSNQSMDFDDLLSQTDHLFSTSPNAKASLQKRFHYLLVDEYQDTNPIQFRLLRHLTEKQPNLCVVGDDDQSIYGWRGADSSLILNFKQHFQGATVVTLDQNYRSTPVILEAAHHVISKNRVRHPKKLWSAQEGGEPVQETVAQDDTDEAEQVAETLLQLKKEDPQSHWDQFAILYRSNAQSRLYEEALRAQQIPYRIVGGLSFLDRREIKDLLSYWRFILNPKDDVSLRRILNRPKRGIVKSLIDTANQWALQNGQSLWEGLLASIGQSPKSEAGLKQLQYALENARMLLQKMETSQDALVLWALETLKSFQYRKTLEEDGHEPLQVQSRMENLEELCHGLGQLKSRNADQSPSALLGEYLSALALSEREPKEKEESNSPRVTLLTLHGAKGLEFDNVFLVGCEDGITPHQKVLDSLEPLDEERRLFYVGMTRAKKRLWFFRASHRIRYGKATPRNRSRFLGEIPEQSLLSSAPAQAEKVVSQLAQIREALQKSSTR